MSTITLTISTEDGATFQSPPIRQGLAMPLSAAAAFTAMLAEARTLTPCQACGATDTRNMLCVDGPNWGLPHVVAP